MQKSGGIIAIISGVFGTLAAVFTLMAGGLVAGIEGASAALEGTAVDTTTSTEITIVGLIGLLCAFLTIVLGAIAMGAKSRAPGYLLIICAIIGIFTGGRLVAVCMVLTLAGGIVATIGTKKVSPESFSK